MFKPFFLFIALIFVFSSQCYAFNWKKCKKDWNPANNVIGFDGLFISSVSSASWTSSTGTCSMLGQIEDEKKYFIAQNLDRLLIDLTRGQGEYLNAYLYLSNCNKFKIKKVGRLLQINVAKIFGEKLNNSAEMSYENIEWLFNNDKQLKSYCGSMYI